jgi:hypothetical protein
MKNSPWDVATGSGGVMHVSWPSLENIQNLQREGAAAFGKTSPLSAFCRF